MLECCKRPFTNQFNRSEISRFLDDVLFTDKSKCNLFGCDDKQKIWRKELQLENLIPTVKNGECGRVVWSCMLANEVGKLQFIKINMDQFVYLGILNRSSNTFSTGH